MIVNKPQFDIVKIKPGQVYWLTRFEYNKRKIINTPALVRHVTPLSISLAYIKEGIEEITIDINSIVNKTFTLEPMTIEERVEPSSDN